MIWICIVFEQYLYSTCMSAVLRIWPCLEGNLLLIKILRTLATNWSICWEGGCWRWRTRSQRWIFQNIWIFWNLATGIIQSCWSSDSAFLATHLVDCAGGCMIQCLPGYLHLYHCRDRHSAAIAGHRADRSPSARSLGRLEVGDYLQVKISS